MSSSWSACALVSPAETARAPANTPKVKRREKLAMMRSFSVGRSVTLNFHPGLTEISG
jgi:hypothetical protein